MSERSELSPKRRLPGSAGNTPVTPAGGPERSRRRSDDWVEDDR
jgi:hypothetical protein